jgi:glutamate-1-semialdehyde 2,1-aminomutase
MPGPITNFSRSFDLQRRLHEIIPGGGHTYSKGEDQFPLLSPQVIERADGAYCWDVDGNKFVDWGMGNRVIILGHNYPAVNDAVKKQIDSGLNFTRPGILEYELAEYLLAFWPWFDMVKFGKNGSDVTTAAVKLARAYTGRKYIARCSDHPFFAIHDWFIGTTEMNSGIPTEEGAYTVGFRYNDIASLEELYRRYPGQIAGVILETVKNDEPRDNFLQKLREVTAREGTVLIFDEMIAGMKFDIRGAHHLYGVYPDMATYGKAISNGFCFSALAGKREIMELGGLHHDKPRVFLLSQTHSSETTGLVACRATLEECQRVDISKHVWGTGRKLVEGFRKLAGDEGVAKFVRIIGFDCNPQILCTHEDGTFWPELHTSFHEEVISFGVLIAWITITYSHGDAELQKTFEALQAGMRKVRGIIDSGVPVNSTFTGSAVKPVFRKYNKCMQSICGRLHEGVPKLACCAKTDV